MHDNSPDLSSEWESRGVLGTLPNIYNGTFCENS